MAAEVSSQINTPGALTTVKRGTVVWFAKARRTCWIGHVERMEDSKMLKREMRERKFTQGEKRIDPRFDG
jgi:hypothetical protein